MLVINNLDISTTDNSGMIAVKILFALSNSPSSLVIGHLAIRNARAIPVLGEYAGQTPRYSLYKVLSLNVTAFGHLS